MRTSWANDGGEEARLLKNADKSTVNGLGSKTVLDAVNVTCKTSIFWKMKTEGEKKRRGKWERQVFVSLCEVK